MTPPSSDRSTSPTADLLFENFEVIAEAPNGVHTLRALILKLAFTGSFSAGTRSDNEWSTTTVGKVARSIDNGFACSKKYQDPEGYVHLRTHNVGTDGRLNFDLLVRIQEEKVHPNRRIIRSGDVIFNNTNSAELVGKTCIVHQDYEYGFSNHLTRIRLKEDVLPGYLVYYFNYLLHSGFFLNLCNRWIGQAGINQKALKAIQVPLPSISEQSRIVEKVEQLMALSAELEEAQRRRREKAERLAGAILQRIG